MENLLLVEKEIHDEVEAIAEILIKNGYFVTVAESLTGGMIASSFVDIAGSSRWFSKGYITYSDEAKAGMLGVDAKLLKSETAVSPNVAAEMAEGALKLSGADFAVAVTGLAGPGSDELGRDAGLVYIGVACSLGFTVKQFGFCGTRTEIRKKTNREAVLLLKRMVQAFS